LLFFKVNSTDVESLKARILREYLALDCGGWKFWIRRTFQT